MTLNVYDAGGIGTPVIFQHGLGGDASQTREVFPDRPWLRCVTVECRGHGASASGDTSEISIASFAAELASFIERRFQRPLVIGGISMGAAICLSLATRRPDLIKGLILARPAWKVDRCPPGLAPFRYIGALLARHPVAEARARFEKSAYVQILSAASPDNLMSLRGIFERSDAISFGSVIRAIASDGPEVDLDSLKRISKPVLVIGTADDYLHPIEHAQWLADTIPGAVLRILTSKSAGRNAYVAEFRAALASFLAEHRGRD